MKLRITSILAHDLNVLNIVDIEEEATTAAVTATGTAVTAATTIEFDFVVWTIVVHGNNNPIGAVSFEVDIGPQLQSTAIVIVAPIVQLLAVLCVGGVFRVNVHWLEGVLTQDKVDCVILVTDCQDGIVRSSFSFSFSSSFSAGEVVEVEDGVRVEVEFLFEGLVFSGEGHKSLFLFLFQFQFLPLSLHIQIGVSIVVGILLVVVLVVAALGMEVVVFGVFFVVVLVDGVVRFAFGFGVSRS
mmetsp:Transcript_23321/g.29400  ORF Transcript_23321/g.29400 Transcript_23321/m.29400 type:complete len:242 (-) Transcript_23321:12-737(-)